MTVRVGIIMDPIAQITFKKDSSLAMLLAAQARNWTIYYMEQCDLYQLGGEARARMRSIKVFNDPQHWYETGRGRQRASQTRRHPDAQGPTLQ